MSDSNGGSREVTATNSSAVIIAALSDERQKNAELRRALWTLVGESKKAAAFLTAIPRSSLLNASMDAEALLSGPSLPGRLG